MDDLSAAVEATYQRIRANPLPADLKRQIASAIEPLTLNTRTDHGDVMDCVEAAFPLIRDYLSEATDG